MKKFLIQNILKNKEKEAETECFHIFFTVFYLNKWYFMFFN